MKTSLLTMAGMSLAAASLLPAAFDASSLITSRSVSGSSITFPLVTAGGIYYTEISVGTPAQKIPVAVDTGSYDLCLIDSSCKVECDAPAKFDAKASSTYVTNQTLVKSEFGFGTMEGRLGSDVVDLRNHKISSQTFIAITQSKGLVAALAPGSGIMGLGLTNEFSRSNGDAQAGVPFWVSMAKSGAIAAPSFTLQLTRRKYRIVGSAPRKVADLQPGGVFTLGAIETKQYTGPITYTTVSYGNAWIIRLDSVKFNGKTINVPSTNTSALIDSGSPFIGGPGAIIEAIYAQIPGAQKEADGTYSIPCDTTNVFSITFSGKEWAMNPADLALQQLGSVKNGKQMCTGTLFPTVGPPSWSIGAPFLNNVFAVFEGGVGLRGPRVGFATRKDPSK